MKQFNCSGFTLAAGVLILATLAAHQQPANGFVDQIEKLYFKLFPDVIKGSPTDKLTILDWLLQDVLPRMIGQRPNNENGTKWEYQEYAYLDESNDDAIRETGQGLITRSGYKFELHDAIADDGYITTLTRIINPLADPKKLRSPPILMEHGGTIDPTAYLIASSIQHHPEKWPRKHQDGPITSWNRSLAFVLANNGFDVWLAETRGADEHDRRHIKEAGAVTAMRGANKNKNMTIGETIDELMRQWTYYSFSMDDIIAHELKSHVDVVLKKTGSDKVHLFSYSLSTPSTLGFLSIRPDYARKIQGYVSMAPIISGDGANHILKLLMQNICPLIPDRIGGIHATDIVMSQPFRELLIFLARSKILRYSIIKSVITLAMGPSPKFGTNMELNLLGHMLRHVSFRLAKQMCQHMRSDKLQKYDYGPIKNKLLYKTTEPPIYDLSDLKVRDWIIVAAANDQLATPEVVNRLVKLANPKPIAIISAPGFNHLDLIGGFENDRYVNLPILKYFQQMSDKYELRQTREEGEDSDGDEVEDEDELVAAGARNLDLHAILPPDMHPQKLVEHASKSLANITTLLSPENFGSIQKGVMDIFSKLGLPNLIKSTSVKKEEPKEKEEYTSGGPKEENRITA